MRIQVADFRPSNGKRPAQEDLASVGGETVLTSPGGGQNYGVKRCTDQRRKTAEISGKREQ